MIKFYADGTEFHYLNQRRPDAFIWGGLLIDLENEEKLYRIIQKIKTKYQAAELPLKWNMLAVEEQYARYKKKGILKKIIRESYDWRKALFKSAAELDFTIILSLLRNFQHDHTNKNQAKIREDLIRYNLSMVLMKVGLAVERLAPPVLLPILDWPENSNPKPYNNEYYYGYHRGHSSDNVNYHCGPLKHLKFNDSLLFAQMNYNLGLQFADILIGAVKDGLNEYCKSGNHNASAELVKRILPKFRGYPDRIPSWGLCLQNTNTTASFNEKIKAFFASLKK